MMTLTLWPRVTLKMRSMRRSVVAILWRERDGADGNGNSLALMLIPVLVRPMGTNPPLIMIHLRKVQRPRAMLRTM